MRRGKPRVVRYAEGRPRVAWYDGLCGRDQYDGTRKKVLLQVVGMVLLYIAGCSSVEARFCFFLFGLQTLQIVLSVVARNWGLIRRSFCFFSRKNRLCFRGEVLGRGFPHSFSNHRLLTPVPGSTTSSTSRPTTSWWTTRRNPGRISGTSRNTWSGVFRGRIIIRSVCAGFQNDRCRGRVEL